MVVSTGALFGGDPWLCIHPRTKVSLPALQSLLLVHERLALSQTVRCAAPFSCTQLTHGRYVSTLAFTTYLPSHITPTLWTSNSVRVGIRSVEDKLYTCHVSTLWSRWNAKNYIVSRVEVDRPSRNESAARTEARCMQIGI